MSFALTKRVIDTTGIPVMQKAALIVLASHAREDGTNSKCPSVQTIADKAGMCAKAARTALRALEDAGRIEAQGTKAGGRYQTTNYRIVVEKLGPTGSTKTRNDVPPKEQKRRYHVPPNGHDTRYHVPPSTAETRYVGPEKAVPRTAESISESNSRLKGPPTPHVDSNPARASVDSLVGEVGGLTGIPSTAKNREIAGGWLQKGWDAELDIVPAIIGVLNTTNIPFEQIRGFGFFTDAIEGYRARRVNPVPARAGNILPINRGRRLESGAAEFLRRADEAKAKWGQG